MANKQEEAARGTTRSGQGKQKKSPQFFSLSITKEEQAVVAELIRDADKLSDVLCEMADYGVVVSVSYEQRQSAYRVLMYERDADFSDRPYVTTYASTALRALGMAAYGWASGRIAADDGLCVTGQLGLEF